MTGIGPWLRRTAVLALALAAAGCGSGGPERYRVSGTVILEGRPIPDGFIIFDPDPSRGNHGPQGYAPIRNGRFDTAAGGEGVPAGAVIVQVQGLGEPVPGFSKGAPLCRPYAEQAEIQPRDNTLDLAVPASARLKEPPGGWVAP